MKLRSYRHSGRRAAALRLRTRAKPYTLVLHFKGTPVGQIRPRKRTAHLFGVVPLSAGAPNSVELTAQSTYEVSFGDKLANELEDPSAAELRKKLQDDLIEKTRSSADLSASASTESQSMKEMLERWTESMKSVARPLVPGVGPAISTQRSGAESQSPSGAQRCVQQMPRCT